MNWKRQISLGNEISFTIGLSIIILISGIIGSNVFLVMIGLLFLLFTYMNQLYLRRVANRLTVNVDKDLIKLFKGEKDEFSITFIQHGFYPILGARVRMTIDSVLQFEHERKMINHEQTEIELPLSLLKKQSVSVRFPFQAIERGVAKIRTLEIRIPHLFGFGDVYLKYDQPFNLETVVYSSPQTIGGINRIVPKNIGEYPMKQSYFEDMSALVGARGYVPTDPFNRVHWKASAKTNSLQTKIYERTSQFSWTIFINVREAKFEELLSGLTYLLEYATIRSIPFELFINVRKAGKIPFIHHPIGTGRDHLQRALEIIARLSKHSVTIPFSQMLYSTGRQFQLSPYVVICGNVEQNYERIAANFRKNGVDCYQMIEHDDAVVLTSFSLSKGAVDSHAI
ncbi:DUF58 domain-containing protein [Bacillus sp. PS06]|uniref:DUF58 domain-containing protein n=1 Tax=Bacillus sp. PS06 TaxID=2764176 RepID=UPI00177E6CDC|nr:DUF58 domain-containing protein [Bacillus sp. PS06]MBD8068508.1 DUF58 domain-containing protein [Bacillus sp. PS06]